MLSINSIGASKNVGELAKYYEGYYTGGENPHQRTSDEPPGTWHGLLAAELGFAGQTVQAGDLLNGFKGLHPKTGEPIVKKPGESHKPGHDLCFSAPKSVSVIWATADEATRKRISELQAQAVAKAMAEAEVCGAFVARFGKSGKEELPVGGLAYAAFEHSSSRAGDPQLHTHCVVLNAAIEGRSITFKTDYVQYLGAMYRAHLAKALQAEGYQVVEDKKSFAIQGVPKPLVDDLSKRAKELREAAKAAGFDSAAALEVAGLKSRDAKAECPRAGALAMAEIAAKKHGFEPESVLQNEPQIGKKWDTNEVLQEFFADQSYYSDLQIKTRLLQAAQTRNVDVEQALTEFQQALAEGKLIAMTEPGDKQIDKHGRERPAAMWYALPETVAAERRMADWAVRAQGEAPGVRVSEATTQAADEALKAKGINLSDEQRNAFRHVVGDNRLAIVQGRAGAGKSTMLEAANDAWSRSGADVIGAALSGKAAEGLQESSGIQSQTLHSLLAELQDGKRQLSERSVIVIDEAGTVGSRQMSQLVDQVQRANAKLVLVGDAAQHQAAEGGGPFLAMQRRAGAAQMSEIRRQNSADDRLTVRMLSEKQVDEAIERMRDRGQVRVCQDGDSRANIAAYRAVESLKEGKSTLVLADTNDAAQEINARARELAIQKGLVDTSRSVEYLHKDGDQVQLAVGDRVMCDKNSRKWGVKNGHTGTVTGIQGDELKVRMDSGKELSLNLKEYRNVRHAYCLTGAKAQGVTVQNCMYVPSQSNQQALYVAASRHKERFELLVTKAMRDHEDGLKAFFEGDSTKFATTDLDLARDKTRAELRDAMSKSVQAQQAMDPRMQALKDMTDQILASARERARDEPIQAREQQEQHELQPAPHLDPGPIEADLDRELLQAMQDDPALERQLREEARDWAEAHGAEIETVYVHSHGR